MGVFSTNPLRSREGNSRLPLYEKFATPSKERDSNDSYDDDSDYTYSSSPSPSTSRNTSASVSSSRGMLSKRTFTLGRGARRPGMYRLPNKIVRYLCIGLVSTILLFMFSLVRASQNENRRILEGKIGKSPPPAPVWQTFPFLTRYYGGVRNIVPFSQNNPEYPRSQDEEPLDKLSFLNVTQHDTGLGNRALRENSEFANHPNSVFKKYHEEIQECFLDKENTMRVPPIRYYDGRPNGFPTNVLGSYEMLGLPEDICFERFGRYGPYGYGYSVRSGGLGIGEHGEKEGHESVWAKVPRAKYEGMDWADAQRRCYSANAARYKPIVPKTPTPNGFFVSDGKSSDGKSNTTLELRDTQASETESTEAAPKPTNPVIDLGAGKELPRTAVIVRVWDEYLWREEDIMNIRSLVSEVSLSSGGRYDVHLLVQVKNDAANPIWADHEIYEKRINESIPEEFRGLATLWTETQMLSLYQGIYDVYARGPDLPVHGVYRGLSMAMQYFAYQHPEYDYFWSWEMDIRYTGHYYDLFTKIDDWAREQPRKGLWERNARFYLPSVHGTWEDFKQMARVQAEMGTNGADNIWDNMPGAEKKPSGAAKGEKPIWGPERAKDPNDWFEPENDPEPPTTPEKDKYVWGVGEEADYITFNPIYDPEGTTWGLSEDITGYNKDDGLPPRRAHIITASRLSRRLLMSMHRETAFKKHFAFPEMWPATVALQHGYKAVYAPHPMYVDREWPTEFFAGTLNNGKNGASGGARTAVFGQREHNLWGLTWFYNSGFAPNLYRRWLGLKVNGDGGEEFELTEDLSKNGTSVNEMLGGEGRMCLPPMLLHPVKDVELPVEVNPEEVEVPESDPTA